jgi:hypothetical protein
MCLERCKSRLGLPLAAAIALDWHEVYQDLCGSTLVVRE